MYKYVKCEQILFEQLTIVMLTQGGVSISDTNEMTVSDRKLLYKHLVDNANKRQQEWAQRKSASKSTSKPIPIKRK